MTPSPQFHSKKLFLFRILVLLLGTAVSVMVYFFVSWQQSEQALSEMQLVAHQRNINLSDQIGSRLAVFESLGATLQSNTASAAAFEKHANIFLRQYSDIHSLYWAPYTPLAAVKDLKKQAASLGIKDFQLYARPSPDRPSPENVSANASPELKTDIAPATSDKFYLPTLYQRHRFHGGEQPGMDLMNTPEWRDSITNAIKNKKIGTARTYTLLNEQERTRILWLFYPVYAESSTTLLGVVAMSLNFSDFIDNAVSTLSNAPVPFEIYDTQDHTKIPLYHWPAQHIFNALKTQDFTIANPLPLFDRELRIVNVATDSYRQKYQNYLSIWLALISLLCTAVVYIIIKVTQTKAEVVHELSNERCWQLEQTNKTLNNKVIEKSTFEKAHKDLQEKLNDYLNLSDDYFWETDAHLRFTYVSRKCVHITGFPANMLIGTSILDNLNPEDALTFKQALDKSVPRKKAFTTEVRCLAQNNHLRLERIHSKPIYDKDGNLAGFRGISRDIPAAVNLKDTPLEDEVLIPDHPVSHYQNDINQSVRYLQEQSTSDNGYLESLKTFVLKHQQTLDTLQHAFVKGQYAIIEALMAELMQDALPLGAEAVQRSATAVAKAAASNENTEKIEARIEALEKHLRPMLENMTAVLAARES